MHTTRRLSFDGAVDADGHILEPPDLWERYLEPKYRDRALRIVADERGLEERRNSLGLVEWGDVVSLAIRETQRQKFLCIEVADVDKYLERLSRAGRIAAKANRSLGFSEITLTFAGLSHTSEEVLAFIEQNVDAGARR